MYKKIIMVAVVVLMASLLAIPSMAKDNENKKGPNDPPGNSIAAHEHSNNASADLDASGEKGPSSPAGQSNIGHLYLYEKISDGSDGNNGSSDWPIVEGGMWGKMKYNLSGTTFDFVFNGHRLPIGEEFTLILHPNSVDGAGLICLGSGIVVEDEDGIGSIHIAKSVDTGDLPPIGDEYNNGAEIVLVPSNDVNCEERVMVEWHESANLYQGAPITFDDTDGITPEGTEANLDASGEKGPSSPAGQSNIGHLYLYEKISDDGDGNNGSSDWPIVEGGMWGKMKYNLSGTTFDFVFNGHRLPIGEEFTLILHPNSVDGAGLICLGSGIVVEDEDGIGSIHIAESVDTGDLPPIGDEYNNGAEIVLVPSNDVNCEDRVMVEWHESANLYQGAPINFDDTDGITPEDTAE